MRNLSGVKEGDELVLRGSRGSRRARVIGAGPEWLRLEPEHQGGVPIAISRVDGRSEGGFLTACTVEEHDDWVTRSRAYDRLNRLKVSVSINGWSTDELVALADAAERIKGVIDG